MDKKRVLIVDDELRLARTLGDALKRALGNECDVWVRTSGEEALQCLGQGEHFDVVITDLKMPGTNGMDLLRYIYRQKLLARTILITAYGTPELEAQVDRLETEYLLKPFNIQDFVDLVRRNLGESGRLKTTVIVRDYRDVINARQKTRELARAIGMDVTSQARISLATSSMANAISLGMLRIGQIAIESIQNPEQFGVRVTCSTTDGKETHIPPAALRDVQWMVDHLTVDALPANNVQITLEKMEAVKAP
jgi:two-component system, response regulator YesN